MQMFLVGRASVLSSPRSLQSLGGGGVSVNKILPFNTHLTPAVGRLQVTGFFL